MGLSILRMARATLDEFDALVAAAQSYRSGTAGRLAIGFCTSLSAGNLRATLLDFRQKFPRLKLATAEKSRTELSRMLRNGTLDILVTAEHGILADFKRLPLWSERILVTLPNDHVFADREVLYWTDLREETVLLSKCDPGREIEDLLHSKLISLADRPKIESHDVSRGTIKALVSMQGGISLVLESDLGANIPSLIYRELRDGTGSSRLGFSAYWRADNESPSLDAFVSLLGQRYASTTVNT